jgi:hypothetical protein
VKLTTLPALARLLAVAFWIIAVSGSHYAQAALVINLVFPDGSNSMNVTPADAGQDFPILVYGTVTGVSPVTQTAGATTGNFDGIQYCYYNVESSIVAGNGLIGNIDSGSTNSSYKPQLNGATGSNGNYGYGFRNNGSQAGVVQDLNGDGIADLGSNTVLNSVAKPRSYPPIWNNESSSAFGASNPTGAQNIIVGGANDNSVSFLLETIYFQIGSSPELGQSTTFDPTLNNGEFSPQYVLANYFMDVPSYSINPVTSPGPNYTYSTEYAGTSVEFTVAASTVVPEPVGAISICMLSAGLLGRRGRTRSSGGNGH